MYTYTHTVSYYETDQMGVTHHSNYLRWMEDARVAYLAAIGTPYEKLEEAGIISPVVSVDIHYKDTTTFADVVDIELEIRNYNGIRLEIDYLMKKRGSNKPVCKSYSSHCFIVNGKVAMLNKTHPEIHKILMDSIQKDQ